MRMKYLSIVLIVALAMIGIAAMLAAPPGSLKWFILGALLGGMVVNLLWTGIVVNE